MPTLAPQAKRNIADAARRRAQESMRKLLWRYDAYTSRNDFAQFMPAATAQQRAVIERVLGQQASFAELEEQMNQSSSELRALFVRGMQRITEAMVRGAL